MRVRACRGLRTLEQPVEHPRPAVRPIGAAPSQRRTSPRAASHRRRTAGARPQATSPGRQRHPFRMPRDDSGGGVPGRLCARRRAGNVIIALGLFTVAACRCRKMSERLVPWPLSQVGAALRRSTAPRSTAAYERGSAGGDRHASRLACVGQTPASQLLPASGSRAVLRGTPWTAQGPRAAGV